MKEGLDVNFRGAIYTRYVEILGETNPVHLIKWFSVDGEIYDETTLTTLEELYEQSLIKEFTQIPAII